MEKGVEVLIAEYKKSKDFEDDCSTLRSVSILKYGSLLDDGEIETVVISEKKKELETKRLCREKGHELSEETEEMIDGQKWTYCQRCGQWFERRNEK